MQNEKLTGYPSIDKPWLSKYRDNAVIETRDITNFIQVVDNELKVFDIC